MERTPAFLLRETNIWQLLAVTLVGAVAVRVGYTLYLSPLAAFPGPLLAKFSNLFRAYRTWKGRIDLDHYDWHQKYGSVVRIGPNTIMLGDPAMIKTVFTVKGVWQKVGPLPPTFGKKSPFRDMLAHRSEK